MIVKSSPGLKLKSPLCPIFNSELTPLKSMAGKFPLNKVCSEKLTFLYFIELKK